MFKRSFRTFISINVVVFSYGYLNGKIDKKLSFTSFNEQKLKDKVAQIEQNECNIKSSNRREIINKMKKEEFDIVIIGGGSAGAGVIQAAAEKGLKVCLIERNDFASGTSSKSTKLAHGGLRYLEDVIFLRNPIEKLKLVKEALAERDVILKSGAFVNNQVEVIIPTKDVIMAAYYFYGSFVYHLIYRFSLLLNYHLKALLSGPFIKYSFTRKQFEIYLHEGQMIDSRQNVLTLLSTQIKNTDSVIGNYIEFEEFIKEDKIIKAALCKDKETGENFYVKAKAFANCTGVFADNNIDRSDSNFNKMVKASKGTHIVVNKNIFSSDLHSSGLIIPKTSDGRLLFILPYQGKYLIGTTDEMEEKKEITKPNYNEIDWIVKEVSSFFNIKQDFIKENITSSFSGQRPIVIRDIENKSDNQLKSVSRKHIIYSDKNISKNLFTLMGGKWTSYLNMGKELLNEMMIEVPELKANNSLKAKDDYNFKLFGSYEDPTISYKEERQMYKYLIELLSKSYPDVPNHYIRKLVSLYGKNASYILSTGKSEGTNKSINSTLSSYYLIYESELKYCIENEYVIKPNDFINRRRSIGFLNTHIAEMYIPDVTKFIGKYFSWTEEKLKAEEELAINNLKYMF